MLDSASLPAYSLTMGDLSMAGSSEVTRVGVCRAPSSPVPQSPQAYTWPAAVAARLQNLPAATSTHLVGRGTIVGRATACHGGGLPKRPSHGHPHAKTMPSLLNATLCSPPAATRLKRTPSAAIRSVSISDGRPIMVTMVLRRCFGPSGQYQLMIVGSSASSRSAPDG